MVHAAQALLLLRAFLQDNFGVLARCSRAVLSWSLAQHTSDGMRLMAAALDGVQAVLDALEHLGLVGVVQADSAEGGCKPDWLCVKVPDAYLCCHSSSAAGVRCGGRAGCALQRPRVLLQASKPWAEGEATGRYALRHAAGTVDDAQPSSCPGLVSIAEQAALMGLGAATVFSDRAQQHGMAWHGAGTAV